MIGRRRYAWTPERDAIVRDRYNSSRGCCIDLGQILGCPAWAVKERAAVLGLSKLREWRPWPASDEAFLQEHLGGRPVRWIAARLNRTRSSVINKAKELGLSLCWRDGYTLHDLELALGADYRAILRWVEKDMLQARRRPESTAPNGPWYFTDNDVLAFFVAHPMAFDLRRVDQLWFMDLAFGNGTRRARTKTAAAAARR